MPTAREILGDENIKQLQALGRDNTYIKQFAQNIYNGTANYQPPEMKITDEQRRQYAQSQEFGGAFKRTMTGIGAGAVEFARGAAMYAEDAANWLDPARARATNGEYGAFVNKTKELLDNYKQHEQSWKEVNGGALNIAGGIGELIGGTLIDPLTYLPIGMANHAKRILSFATTGAISGGVAAYGGDKDVLEGMAFGAVGGVVLGEGIRFLGLAGSKAWNNYKNREIAKAQTQEDFNAINQNENFKNINGENTVLDNQQLDFNVYANDVLKKYPDEIKAQVFKDLETNAQKSIIPDDEFSDLKAFYKVAKDVEEIASTDFKAVDDELVNLKTSVTDGAKDSTLNYYNMLKDIQKEGQNQALSNQQIQTYINAKYQPTKNELEVTHLINDGVMVENRLSGFRVLHSLEQSIANPVLTPDGLNTKLKEAGFNEEVSSILTNAYANKDINIAKSYFNEKIQTKGAERVSSAYEKSIRDSRLSAREVERGGVLRTGQDDSSGGRGVELGHQVDSPTSQNDVGRAVRVAGQDTQPSSTLRGVSKGDERVGELTTTARDGTGDSGASSESVVSAKDELHPRVLKEQQKNEQSQKPSSTDSKENIQTKKAPTTNTSKNYDLNVK